MEIKRCKARWLFYMCCWLYIEDTVKDLRLFSSLELKFQEIFPVEASVSPRSRWNVSQVSVILFQHLNGSSFHPFSWMCGNAQYYDVIFFCTRFLVSTLVPINLDFESHHRLTEGQNFHNREFSPFAGLDRLRKRGIEPPGSIHVCSIIIWLFMKVQFVSSNWFSL